VNTFSQRSVKSGWTTNTIKFGNFVCFGIELVDCDGADILVEFGSRVDKLEHESYRTGHESEGVNEIRGKWDNGGRREGREVKGRFAADDREDLKEAREMKTD
jgi:hypothetical protein